MVSDRNALKVFVGYDSREDIAWQVCRHSMARHASGAISIHPIRQTVMRELGLYTRPFDTNSSTEFSLTRFLTPYLAAANGWAVFCDCDFLFTGDINEVLEGTSADKAVYVVQHDYEPKRDIKMDGKAQTVYPRKNWSSFILFNLDHPDVRALTPDVVNNSPASYLHRFEWIRDQSHIGALDLRWNFLEGEYPRPDTAPTAIHYTNGGPWFEECRNVDFGDMWTAEAELISAESCAA
jgi:lipopolysaccharide biosynthesis glycosyltransferase